MKNILLILTHPISIIFLSTVFTWLIYVGVMKLKRWRDTLNTNMQKVVTTLSSPFIFIALVIDGLYNYLIGSIIFYHWPLPGKVMFTYTLEFYSKNGNLYRKFVANRFCDLLDKSDPSGDHCKRRT